MQTGAMPKNFSKLCVTFCPNNLTIHWERLMDTLGWPSQRQRGAYCDLSRGSNFGLVDDESACLLSAYLATVHDAINLLRYTSAQIFKYV